MLVAAPLAELHPARRALPAVLAVVAWNMAEKHEFATLLRASRGDAVVLLATFLLVVFRDLTEGILVGFGIGALLFLHRMAQAVEIESAGRSSSEDRRRSARAATGALRRRAGHRPRRRRLPDLRAPSSSARPRPWRPRSTGSGEQPKAYVLDFSAVPLLDSTAAATIEGFVRKARRRGAAVYIAGAKPPVRRLLLTHGLRPPELRFRSTLAEAVAAAHGRPGPRGAAPVPVALTG